MHTPFWIGRLAFRTCGAHQPGLRLEPQPACWLAMHRARTAQSLMRRILELIGAIRFYWTLFVSRWRHELYPACLLARPSQRVARILTLRPVRFTCFAELDKKATTQ